MANQRQRPGILASLALVSLPVGSALAADYCVTCQGPAAMYACGIEGTAADAPANARHQLLCITELAKSGGHESCQVPRSAPKPCPGTAKMVQAPVGPGLPKVVGAEQSAAEPAEAPPATSAEANKGNAEKAAGNASAHQKSAAPDESLPESVDAQVKPPRTVEEMAKRSLEASKKSLDDAGDAIKSSNDKVAETAKKTWDCLTSLFSKC